MLELLIILVLGLAAYRATRFLVIDTLTEGPREKLHNFLATRKHFNWFWEKILDLTSCTWCAGVWISALIYYVYLGDFHLNRLDVLSILGIAAVQGLLHSFEPGED